jgi:uncharacterized repeat protein (TIGR02543 family)
MNMPKDLKKQTAAAAIVLAALLAGCLPAVGPLVEKEKAEPPVGKGLVTFRIGSGSGSRNVWTDWSGLDRSGWRYHLVLTRDADQTECLNTDTNGLGVADLRCELVPGDYTLITTAYAEQPSNVTASGEQHFSVDGAETKTLNLYLTPVYGDGNGVFAWKLRIPTGKVSGLSRIEISYTNPGTYQTTTIDVPLNGVAETTGYTLYAGSQTIPVGRYMNAMIQLFLTDSRTINFTEYHTYNDSAAAIAIYSGLTTTIERTIYWDSDYKLLSGTVRLDDFAEKAAVTAYSDAARTIPLDWDVYVGRTLAQENGKWSGEWELAIPVACTEVYFGVKTGTEANPDAVNLGGFGRLENIPAAGQTGLALPLVTYTVTFNTNGGSPVPARNIAEGYKTGWAYSTQAGYTLEWWYKDQALTDKWNFNTDCVTANTTLYAKWEEEAGKLQTRVVGGKNINFRYVPSGRFQRDSGTENISILPKGYWMAETEVTQELFQAVMGVNPSYFDGTGGDRGVPSGETQTKRPVERVSWYDAIVFCNKLSLLDGKDPVYSVSGVTDWANFAYGAIPTSENTEWNAVTQDRTKNGYRLPTEMEWVWAAMGAGKTAQPDTTGHYRPFAGSNGSNSLNDYAWYGGNSSSRTHEVGKKIANELNLYDMSGNVAEWVWDWWDYLLSAERIDTTGPDSVNMWHSRIVRGGNWSSADLLEGSGRPNNFPVNRGREYGFRIVSLDPASNAPIEPQIGGEGDIAGWPEDFQLSVAANAVRQITVPPEYTVDVWYIDSKQLLASADSPTGPVLWEGWGGSGTAYTGSSFTIKCRKISGDAPYADPGPHVLRVEYHNPAKSNTSWYSKTVVFNITQ